MVSMIKKKIKFGCGTASLALGWATTWVLSDEYSSYLHVF